MNHQYQRRILTPGTARPKLKEREPFNPGKPSPLAPPRPPQPPRATVTAATTGQGGGGAKPMAWNQLLAGYMAHEFLTKGTLLGKRKSVAEAEPRNAVVAKPTETKKPNESYNEVTSLLMMIKGGGDGPCIPGVVNPTQLAQWIQM